uniref:Prolyl endopeptidase n=1 Tax=Saccoglossus kowalevskii TaxID=10224 RepID=A0ABM0LWS1_SACKO|nr:PREDICTED: prolyl endopeptidase-like [Saccoglossus kowalevskii]
MGRQWYREGRLNKKHKSFEDVEACLKHLHDAGYSCAGKTAVCGTSAGGLLMATVCNRSPHLIKAAVLKVPFVDVLNTMLDPMQPLTSQEYEEFGNPLDDRNILDYIDRIPFNAVNCKYE